MVGSTLEIKINLGPHDPTLENVIPTMKICDCVMVYKNLVGIPVRDYVFYVMNFVRWKSRYFFSSWYLWW